MYVGCTKNFCLMDYAKVFTLSFLSPVKLYINSYFKKYMRCSVKTFSSRLLLIAWSFYVGIYNAEMRVTAKCIQFLAYCYQWKRFIEYMTKWFTTIREAENPIFDIIESWTLDFAFIKWNWLYTHILKKVELSKNR